MAVPDRNAGAVRPHLNLARDDTPRPAAEQFLRLPSHLLVLLVYEGEHVPLDVQGGDAGIAGTGEGLVCRHVDPVKIEGVGERFEGQDESRHGTVRIRDDEATAFEGRLLL